MRIRFDALEIQNKHLNYVFWTHNRELCFKGVALEEGGKAICKALSNFKKGEIVEVFAETRSFDIYEGICEILEIETPPPEVSKAPVIYRFSGRLKPVE